MAVDHDRWEGRERAATVAGEGEGVVGARAVHDKCVGARAGAHTRDRYDVIPEAAEGDRCVIERGRTAGRAGDGASVGSGPRDVFDPIVSGSVADAQTVGVG